MSGLPYEKFLSSEPFRIVGPGKRSFYVHGTLLSESSPVFRKDVLGGMQETRSQTIEIKDVEGDIDDDTVMRFIEYAYSGEYTVPEPDIVPLPGNSKDFQEIPASTTSPVHEDDVWGMSSTSKRSKKDVKKKRKSTLFDDIFATEPAPVVQEDDYCVTTEEPAHQGASPASRFVNLDRQKLWTRFRAEPEPAYRPFWQPRTNDKSEDYTPVFLCHARLYKLSDRYNCEELMALTLRKLHLTLSSHIFYPSRAADVVELIQYTYAHTTDVESRSDKLRVLVLDYAVCYFRELMDCSSFRELLQEGGPLSLELMIRLADIIA